MSAYKAIEELEAKINSAGRDPAAIEMPAMEIDGDLPQRKLNYNEQKKIIDLPFSSGFADPSVPRNLPGAGGKSADSVVGGVAPDYSGYDELIKNLKGPRDTSNQDLINMGVSTGIGLLFGRPAVGAKVAGEYGLQRATAQEKRQDDFEKQLLALQQARAIQMAKGVKGTKLKGGSGGGLDAKDLYKMKYVGSDGLERNYRYVDNNGRPVPDENDPIANLPTIQFTDRKNADGSVEQMAKTANQIKTVGSQNADTRVTQGPNGELIAANTRTGTAAPLQGLNGLDTQKTVAGVSPKVKTDLMKIQADFEKDGQVAKLEQANADIMQMINALPTAGPENLLEIKRLLGIAMDKGRSLTNDEFAKVSDLDLGWLNKVEGLVQKGATGEATNLVRQSYEKMGVSIEKSIRELYNKKVARYNDRIKFVSGTEFKPELLYGMQTAPTAKKQMAASRAIEQKAADLSAGTTRQMMVTGPDGKKVNKTFRYNGETKKWDMVR